MSDTDGLLELNPPRRDLGDGFTVRRALPARERRSVGPFVFFDQMGPAAFTSGGGLDVRPHPHIGLATMTYLFEGEILHRDSLGTVQIIRPGEVNWMLAGRGIVHSERTPPEMRRGSSPLSGIQVWIGLPSREEEVPPAFSHHAAAELPELSLPGVHLRLVAGTLAGARSPVQTLSPLFYADAQLEAGATLALDDEHAERAMFVCSGDVRLQTRRIEPGRMLVFPAGGPIHIDAHAQSRVLLLGGAPLDSRRYLWWNFVASSREQLTLAAERWRAGNFPPVPGDDEFIPLPDTPLPSLTPAGSAPTSKPVDYP
jgi:redox-sensitive bicupin YhaK (pirin superfamily)